MKMTFLDLGNNIFDSFLTDDEARKEFPIVETIDRKINMIAADAIVRLKKVIAAVMMIMTKTMPNHDSISGFRSSLATSCG